MVRIVYVVEFCRSKARVFINKADALCVHSSSSDSTEFWECPVEDQSVCSDAGCLLPALEGAVLPDKDPPKPLCRAHYETGMFQIIKECKAKMESVVEEMKKRLNDTIASTTS